MKQSNDKSILIHNETKSVLVESLNYLGLCQNLADLWLTHKSNLSEEQTTVNKPNTEIRKSKRMTNEQA